MWEMLTFRKYLARKINESVKEGKKDPRTQTTSILRSQRGDLVLARVFKRKGQRSRRKIRSDVQGSQVE